MSNRRLHFFARPAEFQDLLQKAESDLGLKFLKQKVRNGSLYPVSLPEAISGDRWRFFITEDIVDTERPIASSSFYVSRWGLVICDRPRFEDGALLMSVLSSKSDWTDEQMQPHENMRGHQTLGKLRRRIAKVTSERVYVRSLDDPSQAATLVRDVKCTPDAAAWAREGGKMKQWGVDRTEFIVLSG